MTNVTTGSAPVVADGRASRSSWRWVTAHAGAVSLLSALYAVASFSAEDPNIGAGLLALLLQLLGLPWSVDGWFPTAGLSYDALFVGAAFLNVAVHAALHLVLTGGRARASRLAAEPDRRLRAIAVLAVAAPLGVLIATGVAAHRHEASLREQAQLLLPLAPWTVQSTQVPHFDCLFCAPQSLSTSSGSLGAPLPSEPDLLAAVDRQLQERDAVPDDSWSCQDLDVELQRSGGEAGPGRRRQCLRFFATDQSSVFVVVTFYDDVAIDPELRLDVTEQ